MSLPAFTATTNTANQLPPPPLPHNPTTNPPPPNTITVNGSPQKHQPTCKTTQNKPNTLIDELIVSWTSSIAYHCQKGRLSVAASEFNRMRLSGVEPNHITFVSIISGCAHFPARALCFGAAIHGYTRKLGLDTGDVKVGSALIDMYSKFGQMGLARLCFDHMGFKNKVSWNTMIDGYMRNGDFEAAVNLFDEMPERDAITWTALIGGFSKQGLFQEALVWFQEMQLSGQEPDYVTLISLLSAIANLGMLGLGLWLHRYVMGCDLRDNIRVNNSLIDMYCRCGSVDLARQVFKSMPKRSLVSWNSIIVGLAMNGHAEEAIEYFWLMQKDGFEPDAVSFTGALTACSHAGLVKEGLNLFSTMSTVHRISPRIEHYGCMVDLYSRAGMLENALEVIEDMPMKPNEVVLGSLLAACRNKGDVKLAERLMSYIYQMDPEGDSNHVLLSNIYAALGSWHGASHVRKKMKALGVRKKPGISSIELDGVIHEFVAGDKSHVETEYVYAMLELLSLELRLSGYMPESNLSELYEYD
ncbi:pentatricopeptide repeat-containing protein At1g05750, chloroplastic-like [Coffea arabica]|uniref:Pentatricopeptide repeat-containing protein At1g05750, chloroplastic-like n=1 Tax=Coffea arabica TaxID=13443 RepID=A0A6P6TYL9_COFAR|nr:pentatricopeptide repeat-containing protein At1g05750, chloroplastic-like [Coffea arabica]